MGFRVSGLALGLGVSGLRVWDLWFRVWVLGLEYRVWGLGCRVWGLGFRCGICGMGFRAWGFGLGV